MCAKLCHNRMVLLHAHTELLGGVMDTVEKTLGAFGEQIGISSLAFDASGTCALSFDDVVVNLELVRDKGRLYAFTVITTLPDESAAAAALCQYGLEQNLGLAISGAGMVGLSQQHGLIYANSVGTDALALDGLEAFLESHVNTAEGLREAAREIGAETPGVDSAYLSGMALRV